VNRSPHNVDWVAYVIGGLFALLAIALSAWGWLGH
jgi:hypothetical protein